MLTTCCQATLRNLLNQLGYESLEAVREKGRSEGHSEGLRQAVYTACALLDIKVSGAMHAEIEQMDSSALLSLCEHLKRERAWP